MSPWPFDVVLLALTAVFCLWLSIVAYWRRRVPGAAAFVWLMLALVVWTGLSAIHRLPLSLEVRVLVAQLQVIGIVAVVEVSDTGSGMSPETALRMFDPFFTTKTTGRGLGLASVQGIVRHHRGALGVYSAEGRGTTIRVWLRVA